MGTLPEDALGNLALLEKVFDQMSSDETGCAD
jgi:hypothetical protein